MYGKGFLFGFIDNLIVAISSILGIHIDNYFSGYGIHGALYGALIGHTLSDFIAGYSDFGLNVGINMAIGCFVVLCIVYIYFLFADNYSNL
jgi:hypothetical protein